MIIPHQILIYIKKQSSENVIVVLSLKKEKRKNDGDLPI